MVAFMSRKSESKTEIAVVPGQVQRLAVFGPPLLLEGEDAAAYDELLGRICAAVKPVDIIDEIFIADIVALEWDVLRLRRLKLSLIRARGLEPLEAFLAGKLGYDLYAEHVADRLTEILRDNLPEEHANAGPGANAEIQELARRVAEAQIDLRRVRHARHQFLSDTLSNEYYDSYANMRMKVKLLRALLRPNPPDMSMETLKFATSMGEAKKLLAMDRYEQRALSRRKFAIRAFDAARPRTATMGRVNVTRTR
jgi:hypothetical protein